uniref:Uncharacterized protein n=1 Tax=Arundo donax TaxID=35708 RepID=A0A0A9UK36_ARUDO
MPNKMERPPGAHSPPATRLTQKHSLHSLDLEESPMSILIEAYRAKHNISMRCCTILNRIVNKKDSNQYLATKRNDWADLEVKLSYSHLLAT